MLSKSGSVTTAALLLVFAFAASASAADRVDDDRYRFQDHFAADLSGIEEVRIDITNGHIDLRIGGGGGIDIEVEEKVKARSASEAESIASEIKLVGRRSGSRLVIELDLGRYRNDIYRNNRFGYGCDLTVSIPDNIKLDLETTNGWIKIPRMRASVRAETTNGDVELEGCVGGVELETTNGNIDAGLVEGRLKAETTNGDVRGAISGALRGDVIMETTNGGIYLAVDPSASFRIEAETTHGRVYCDIDGAVDFNRRRTSASGVVGGGEHRVTLDTTNGSIEVRRR